MISNRRLLSALKQETKGETICRRDLSLAQMYWGMGAVFHNLGTTNNLCLPPRVPFDPPKVPFEAPSVLFDPFCPFV